MSSHRKPCRRGKAFDKPSVPIGPVLEHYGARIPSSRGGWQAMKCPFHSDSNSSASVNLESNHFCCHAGCTEQTEDTVGLVQWVDNLDFQTAYAKAKELAGVSGEPVRAKRERGRGILDEPWG